MRGNRVSMPDTYGGRCGGRRDFRNHRAGIVGPTTGRHGIRWRHFLPARRTAPEAVVRTYNWSDHPGAAQESTACPVYLRRDRVWLGAFLRHVPASGGCGTTSAQRFARCWRRCSVGSSPPWDGRSCCCGAAACALGPDPGRAWNWRTMAGIAAVMTAIFVLDRRASSPPMRAAVAVQDCRLPVR